MYLGSNKQEQMTWYDGQEYENATLGLDAPNFNVAKPATSNFDWNNLFDVTSKTIANVVATKADLAQQKLNFKRQQLYQAQQDQARADSFASQNPLSNMFSSTPTYYPQQAQYQQNAPFNLTPYIPYMLAAGGVFLLVTLLNNSKARK